MTDYIDDRELMEQAELAGLTRWLPTVVVGAVLVAFVTLAWYAYHAETQSLKDDDLMVVEADKTPMKEKPLDPGGMQFPNQDKTVFETFSGNMQQPPKVENVLPAPEEPMNKHVDDSGTTTWINDKLHKSSDTASEKTADKRPAKTTEQVIGAEEKNDNGPRMAPVVAIQPVVSEAKATPVADTPKTQVAALQKNVKASVVSEGNEEVDEASHKTPPVRNTGAVKIQLGAYRSEQEARDAWNKMLKKNTTLSGRQPLIVKADLGAKGIYYRLRMGGFETGSEAKAFCGKLEVNGQACILSAAK